MYSIGQIAQLTGLSAYTLRYYEKMGVLPRPDRSGGGRLYREEDLQYIRFVHGLKQTGMRLSDISVFTESGCLLHQQGENRDRSLQTRVQVLDEHILHLEQQLKHLSEIKLAAEEKRTMYKKLLEGSGPGP